MRKTLGLAACAAILFGCTGGAAGDPSDDLDDLVVISHSPGNRDELDLSASLDGFNALNNPTLRVPGKVTIMFSTSLDPTSVINPDPTDPQRSRNVRLFFFDRSQGPFDPQAATVPGVNPPGANVPISATTELSFTNQPNDTILIAPTGFTAANPMPEGQYSVILQKGVRAADGTPMRGAEYFFFFRVGQDVLAPSVVTTSPANGERGVDPTSEIRITMSETILASTVTANTLQVLFQPTGAPAPTQIPGTWFADGGNGPGNNFPGLQLDAAGNPGFSGQSPRNGVDLVFRPDLDGFPVNMLANDPNDAGLPNAMPPVPGCALISDPPEKGNRGFPLGQVITVRFDTTGLGITDTAGLSVIASSPLMEFSFETKRRPDPVFAPGVRGAIYFADPIGVGVIDADPARTPYQFGPNPARPANSVVRRGDGPSAEITRVPVQQLVDLKTDIRPYTAFYSFVCSTALPEPSLYHPLVYVASRANGGEIVLVDSFQMTTFGRWRTGSPGGIALTALGTTGVAVVSNFSSNTVTLFDIGHIAWFDITQGLPQTQAGLAASGAYLILREEEFAKNFPAQRADPISPPGPPILGTIIVGTSPSVVEITQLPGAWGNSPIFSQDLIVGALNSGESTADFSMIENVRPEQAHLADLKGVSLSTQGSDLEWTPVVFFPTGRGLSQRYFAFISTVGGTVELFVSGGGINKRPSVSTQDIGLSFAPNQVINQISGLDQPTGLQYITNGTAISTNRGYSAAVLVAEAGANRVTQLGVPALVPGTLFEKINSTGTGLGPTSFAGDPVGVRFFPAGPRFTTYYVGNAGGGTVRRGDYVGGVIGTDIPVPGVFKIASWWTR